MKLARTFVAIIAVAAVAACEEDPADEGPTLADFGATWNVQSFTYVADADASKTTNLSAIPATQGGPYGITSLTIATNGSFTGNLRLPGSPIDPIPIGGQIVLGSGNNLTVDFDAATEGTGVLSDESGTFAFSNNRQTLTLVLPDVTFDHSLSGQAGEESDLTIVATR